MKKKVIFAVATGLFALATVFNMNVLQANSAGDISLESIMIMQKAEAEMHTVICHGSQDVCITTINGPISGYRAGGTWPY